MPHSLPGGGNRRVFRGRFARGGVEGATVLASLGDGKLRIQGVWGASQKGGGSPEGLPHKSWSRLQSVSGVAGASTRSRGVSPAAVTSTAGARSHRPRQGERWIT